MSIQGLGQSGAVVTTLSEICIAESRARLDLVWSELKRVVTDARVALPPTLADDLIAEFNQYLGSVLRLPKEHLETHIRNAGMVSPTRSDFDVLVESLIAKVRAEIALFVLNVEKTPQYRQEVQPLKLTVTDDPNTDLRQLRAFLSHSTQDKLLVSNLAKYLLAKGIDAWYAEWEIIPGDSLRRKVDEGIGKASHFLVILSPSSLRSRWVQTELDAGMVKRIEGTCTLIPVVYGLGDIDVPLTLRGIRWVRVELDQTGFKELADAILGLSSKPLLGSLSAKTGDRGLQ